MLKSIHDLHKTLTRSKVYLSVNARATGSLLWITMYIRRKNSSMLVIFSKCFPLCWVTRKTQRRRKLLLPA